MRKTTKKLLSLILAGSMVLSFAGCSKDSKETSADPTTAPTTATEATATTAPDNTTPTNGGGRAEYDSEGRRIIKVGTWYDHYYTSDHDAIEDNPDVTDVDAAQMQLDNMRAIEEKYNVKFQFVNLTWEGVMESINVSIMSGKPDVDIYECDLQFGVPAAMNGYAMNIADFAAADNDIFTDQNVLTYLNIMDSDENYLFKQVNKSNQLGGSPLSFNMDMIKEANLENPQDLWDRGEWTWDKFEEYLKVLTKDTNGDGATDVYGYAGWWTVLLQNLLMSNGATIAGDVKEGLSSPSTIETMELIQRMYVEDKTAAPWNQDDWNANNQLYGNKQCAFFTGAAWVYSEFGISPDCGFEIGVVPWPVGPSGNKDTNNQVYTNGSYYFIPNGVEDPQLVYNVFYDWCNWFNGDLELRDDVEWFQNQMMTERNYQYLEWMGTKEEFDIWQNLGLTDFSMVPIMNGEQTAAQYAEATKQIVQDALDRYFK
jgi:hypothetical protein